MADAPSHRQLMRHLLVASKDAKVVVDLVVRRAVIVVQAAPVSGVIRHDEVVVDVVQCAGVLLGAPVAMSVT
jgi:hypothetical protein